VDVKTAFTFAGVLHLGCVEGWNVSFQSVDNPNIDKARNRLMFDALKSEADWLLSIDADNHAPPPQIMEMIRYAIDRSNGKSLAVIGAPYKRRALTAEREGYCLSVDGLHVKEIAGKGIIPVDAIGFGMVCINLEWVRTNMPGDGPWFETLQLPKAETLSEDFRFCSRVRELGGIVLCDTRVDCGHETQRSRG